jgi:hypothetical protein
MDITAILFLLIVTLILHLVEEIKTGFRERFPLGEMPKPVFVGINILLYVFCFGTLLLSWQGNALAIPLAWLFALAMFINGIGHIGIMFLRREYFPGGVTTFALLLVSSWLMVHLLSYPSGGMFL